jgi:hypothetical protein
MACRRILGRSSLNPSQKSKYEEAIGCIGVIPTSTDSVVSNKVKPPWSSIPIIFIEASG